MHILTINWLVLSITGLFITLSVLFIVTRLHRFITRKIENSRYVWDSCVLNALYRPLQALTISFGIIYTLYHVCKALQLVVRSDISFTTLKLLLLNIIFLWFIVRFISGYEKALFALPAASRKFDKTTIRAISQISSIAITLLVILNIINPIFGVPISALLAFGGIGGIAVALACQDLLANIFGGFYIYLDRPFVIGDWVSSPEKNIEGVVEQIGLRLTRIRTFEKRVRYIPNSVFSKIIVENASRMTHRRIRMTIGVRYDDAAALNNIIQDVDTMLGQHNRLDHTMTTYARFVDFSASSLDFEVYAFTTSTRRADFLSIKQDVAAKIIEIIGRHKAECAFPTRTVHIVQEDKD